MNTAFTHALGIKHPIIQAPMAGVSSPRLVAAVSNAGALGSIAVGALTPKAAEATLEEISARTDAPFAVNVFTHKPALKNAAREEAWLQVLAPYFKEAGTAAPTSLSAPYPSFVEGDAMLEVFVKAKPRVVSFHFGLPRPDQITALKAAGCFLMATATSTEEAKAIEKAGIDAIVAQGYEAGGHRGIFTEHDPMIGTFDLLAEIKSVTSLPIIAAGGLMTGADIAATIKAGAVAGQLGTAFVPCPEALTAKHYRAKLLTAKSEDTAITRAISGRPARGFKNRFMDLSTTAQKHLPDYPIAYDAGKALVAAWAQKEPEEFAVMWAGTGAHKSRQMPAAELVKALVRELENAL